LADREDPSFAVREKGAQRHGSGCRLGERQAFAPLRLRHVEQTDALRLRDDPHGGRVVGPIPTFCPGTRKSGPLVSDGSRKVRISFVEATRIASPAGRSASPWAETGTGAPRPRGPLRGRG
jgi:hypothetical protein